MLVTVGPERNKEMKNLHQKKHNAFVGMSGKVDIEDWCLNSGAGTKTCLKIQ